MTAPVGKGNILVVDDEPQITRVLMATLTGYGYGARTASDSKEALQLMKDWALDLIITESAHATDGWFGPLPSSSGTVTNPDHRALRSGLGAN